MISEESIKDLIVNAEYRKMGKKTTVCLLTLKSGFEVVGYSACVDVNDFDPVIGMDMAFKNAKEKIWELEGYLLQNGGVSR